MTAVWSQGRGPVLGWRLPMEQTDVEGHGIESSRQITAREEGRDPGARQRDGQTDTARSAEWEAPAESGPPA